MWRDVNVTLTAAGTWLEVKVDEYFRGKFTENLLELRWKFHFSCSIILMFRPIIINKYEAAMIQFMVEFLAYIKKSLKSKIKKIKR